MLISLIVVRLRRVVMLNQILVAGVILVIKMQKIRALLPVKTHTQTTGQLHVPTHAKSKTHTIAMDQAME
jgi:hypothetical protein